MSKEGREQKSESKLAVVTIATGELYQKISEITHPTLKAYADKCHADFIVWDSFSGHTQPGYQKLEIKKIYEQGYERVLYVDSDILIRADAPNLFQMVPAHQVALLNEGSFVDRRQAKRSFNQDPNFWASPTYYNTGVMLTSKEHRYLFADPAIEINNFYEQTHLNHMLYALGYSVFELPYVFNRMLFISKLTGEDRLDCYFLHYAGQFSSGDSGTKEIVLEMMAQDAKEFAKPKPHYPRRIYCDSSGGLGDVIATEPVVRYMREKLYSRDIFVLKTPWPEVFSHLESDTFKILGPDETIPDEGYYEIRLMPKPDDPVNAFITHSLCHPTDYAAIMGFKGQLPTQARRIKLETSEKIGVPIDVLIHPGKGWPSKTFPVSFWESIARILKNMGLKTAVFGSKIVDVDKSLFTYDFSGERNLKELFALVRHAPILLSNDSAPIHIAGAFNNWVCMIQSCKKADIVLPYRNGTASKTKVFGDVIERNFAPNQLVEVRLDDCDEKDLLKSLPKAIEVATFIIETHRKLREEKVKRSGS